MEIRDFYSYSAVFTALAAGAAATYQIPIQADSDFVVQKQNYFAEVAHAGQTANSRVIPLISVLITDTGSGRQIMDKALPLTTFFGTGENPFILPQPKVFKANTILQITASNFDAAQAYNLTLVFIGIKLFQIN